MSEDILSIDNEPVEEEGVEEPLLEDDVPEEQDAPAVSAPKSDYLTFDERLLKAKIALLNASTNNSISTALEEFAYDSAKFAEGLALLDTATDLTDLQKETYSTRIGLNRNFIVLFDALTDYFRKYKRIARFFFGDDPGAADLLGLYEDIKERIGTRLGQIRRFFSHATNSDLLPVFIEHNITLAVLNNGLAKVNEVEVLYAEYKEAFSIAQQTTQERNAAVEELEHWVDEMIVFAKAALDDDQLLEALGVLVRTPAPSSKDRQKEPPKFPLPPFDVDPGLVIP